tara:strand:+ start:120 stop:311 length:192 start_codon:yes stop_codon:yes gene_type:complete
MITLSKLVARTLGAFASDEDGLLKPERSLLAGVLVMTFLTVLILLGVDLAELFGIEPPVDEEV